MMKKIWAISIAAALALSLTACGAGNVTSASSAAGSSSSQAAPVSSAAAIDAGSVSDDLAGLQKYLVSGASVSGTAEKMRYDIIGAKSGVRYKYSAANGKDNVTLELYEFDPSNLNSKAQEVISSVKSSGKFTLLGQQVGAVLSKNGKYLMIYKNTMSDSANASYGKNLQKLFTEFKA